MCVRANGEKIRRIGAAGWSGRESIDFCLSRWRFICAGVAPLFTDCFLSPPPHHPTPPPPPSATPSPFSTPSSPSLTFFVGWGVGGRRFGFEAVGGSLERVEADVGVGLGGGGWWVEWVLRPPPPPPPPPQAFSRPVRRWIGFFKRLYLVFFYRVFSGFSLIVFYFDSIFFLVWSLISGPRSLY